MPVSGTRRARLEDFRTAKLLLWLDNKKIQNIYDCFTICQNWYLFPWTTYCNSPFTVNFSNSHYHMIQTRCEAISSSFLVSAFKKLPCIDITLLKCKWLMLTMKRAIDTEIHSMTWSSGRSRGGACPPPYFGEKNLQKEEKPAGQAKKKPSPSPTLSSGSGSATAWSTL